MNPFKYGCVVTGENFCHRPELEKQLQRHALDGQNIVIQGERRIGKTSLVKHAIGNLHCVKLLYADLYAIRNLSDLCHRVAIGIASMSNEFSFIKKAISFISSLRPTLTIDAQTGAPTLSVDARAANEPQSLQVILSAIEKLAKSEKFCVVFDEFQDILKIDNSKQIIAEMRSRIQFQSDIPYFFMGSIRNDMMEIFSSPDSPFFKSAMPFDVGVIEKKTFSKFIISRFKAGKRKIGDDTALAIIDFASGISGDVQELCKALWDCSEANDVLTENDIPRALEIIYAHEMRGYDGILSRLTPIQLGILTTLAKTRNSEVCGKQFLEDAAMTNPSVVKRVINKLLIERIIYLQGKEYRFINPFFREWLAHKL